VPRSGASARAGGAQRGDGLGGDVVERVGGVVDHHDPVAFNRQGRDPDAQVDGRDVMLGEPANRRSLPGGQEHRQGLVTLLRVAARACGREVGPVMVSAERERRDVVNRLARATAVHARIRKHEPDCFGRDVATEPFGTTCALCPLRVAVSCPPCGLHGAFAIAEAGLLSLAFLGDGSPRRDPLAVSLLVVAGATPLALWIEPVARRPRARFAERLAGDVSSEWPSAACA
jgi:hypothetical protein